MKYFAFVLLFGLASASLLEIYPDSDEQDFLLKSKPKGGDEIETELGRQLRKTLDQILKQIKQTVQEGKEVSQELINQAKDLIHKLKNRGEDISEEAKDLLNYLDTRVQRWVDELLDILAEDNSTVHRTNNDVQTDLGKKLHDFLDRIVNRIKQSVDEGKHVSEELLDTAKKIVKKLKDYGVTVSNNTRSWLEELKSKYSELVEEILDIIHGNNTTVHKAQEDVKTELGKSLRDAFERVLKRIKQAIKEGKHISKKLIDEAKDLFRRLKEQGLEIRDEIKDMFHYLVKRYNTWLQKLIDLIQGNDTTVYSSEPEVKTELAKKLREEFKHIIKRIKETIEEGKHVSQKLWDEAKELASKLKEYGLNVKNELHDMFEFGKERFNRWVQELIDAIHGKKSTL